MTHKEKILQFIDYKRVSKAEFSRRSGLSAAYLDTKGSITSDKLSLILKNFSDLSVDWLLFGKGNMIKPDNNRYYETTAVMEETPAPYGINYKEKYYELLEENRLLLKVLIKTGEIGKGEMIKELTLDIENELGKLKQARKE